VTPRFVVSVEEGLENAGFTVTTKPWLGAFDEMYRAHRENLRRELQQEAEQTGIDCLHLLYARPHDLIPCQRFRIPT